jgi:hypothetical protein
MWRKLILIVPWVLGAATVEVEVRDSEVWVIRDGQPKQLTRDGRSKLQPVLSPLLDRVAYYEICTQKDPCTPSVVLLDLEGNRVQSFHPMIGAAPSAVPCNSILWIEWAGPDAIAAECHINPSLSEYVETKISTGQATRHLLGYDFTRSPDGKKVAHVGSIPHFAPPFAKSNYLQIESATIYPLPRGKHPVAQANPPDVVRNKGLTYSGIHDFRSGLAWSPDSQRIALIDCTYDWTADDPSAYGGGKDSNQRCSIAVVAPSGRFALIPLSEVPAGARLVWLNSHQIALSAEGVVRNIEIPYEPGR